MLSRGILDLSNAVSSLDHILGCTRHRFAQVSPSLFASIDPFKPSDEDANVEVTGRSMGPTTLHR